MRDDELVSILNERIERARGSGVTEGQEKLALDYYLNRPRGDEVQGRSQVQSSDVADMVHAVMAQLMPAFSLDSLCELEPAGPGDEQAASLEGRAVNRALMETNRGYVAIQQAIHNALLMGQGILKLWAEDYEAEGPDEIYQAEGGMGVSRRTTRRRRLRLASVDPLNFLTDEGHDSPLLDDCRGCYERKEMSRGELVSMGISRGLVEELPLLVPDWNSDIRKPGSQGQAADTRSGWASEPVEVWECYVRLSLDDGGTETLYRILKGENTLLLKEKSEYICYAVGTPIILPAQVRGLGLYDRIKAVQDIKTSITRQMIDSFAASNLSRTAVNSEVVNMKDLLTGRVNGVVRVRGIPAEHLMALPNQDISTQAIQALTYMDQVRADRGGASLAMQNPESQLISSQIGATGAMAVLNVQEMVAGWYAQNIAQTMIRSAFLHAHRLLRTEVKEPILMQVADQWVEVNPVNWPARDRINISAGLSPGERARKAASLQAVVSYQTQLLTGGLDGVLVTPSNIYSAIQAWGRAAGIDGIERMFTDPTGQGAQMAGQQKAMQAQQLQQIQLQMEQQKTQLEAQKLELDKYKHDGELRWKYYDTDKDNEAREAELVGGATRDLALAEITGRQAAARDTAGAERPGGQGRGKAA